MSAELEIPDNDEATLDRILGELDAGVDDLPIGAILAAREHRQQIIPRLIRAIRDAAARTAAGDVPEGNAHFFALFLLAEFQAAEALAAIIEAVSLPGELPFDLFGDTITESLPRILAALVGNELSPLEDLAGNRAANDYVRIAAANAYRYLVRDGRLARDEAVDRLRVQLRAAIEEGNENVVTLLLCALTDYAPREALDEIKQAFDLGLVDESMIVLEEIEDSIAAGDEELQKRLASCAPTGIPDAIHELERWAAFAQPAEEEELDYEELGDDFDPDFDAELDDPDFKDDADFDDAQFDDASAWTPPGTIRNTAPRVGRNDPCPCGSGKKFKKCCGRK
jgi:hypothetical protein